ncbi:Dabb family protein [Paraburkholderia humisilvae]|uniref:Stress-response A/B barrel domain-containing protein n=1 Tax=Paraburkholderia humisilvae TaxID=627669 RepID=A0A6J5F731_9BURK|nr:Dabb family protein [Paraburkholderia humisilvae]CAB3774700.1 hypothetical protein LMG29542_08078 [Paraburkholderia humisilvae]
MKLKSLVLGLGCCALPRLAVSDALLAEYLAREQQKVGVEMFTSENYKVGLVRHIVLFKYKKSVTLAERNEIKLRFLALKTESLMNGHRYIKSIEAGDQVSGEGLSRGVVHVFVVTFLSEGSRNYYVGDPLVKDPLYYDAAHADFKKFVGRFLSEVTVVDYRPGDSKEQQVLSAN